MDPTENGAYPWVAQAAIAEGRLGGVVAHLACYSLGLVECKVEECLLTFLALYCSVYSSIKHGCSCHWDRPYRTLLGTVRYDPYCTGTPPPPAPPSLCYTTPHLVPPPSAAFLLPWLLLLLLPQLLLERWVRGLPWWENPIDEGSPLWGLPALWEPHQGPHGKTPPRVGCPLWFLSPLQGPPRKKNWGGGVICMDGIVGSSGLVGPSRFRPESGRIRRSARLQWSLADLGSARLQHEDHGGESSPISCL
ncbi:hypothetical protein Taro_039457 [Colocasia esculenta]|uniref:Uncharacterized protein n=1 Tax=Colocasia esculenta TaxID=4460 RepID=A0A843WVT8_COLES|nr:hypothetical protein [Colocasia esculenta]